MLRRQCKITQTSSWFVFDSDSPKHSILSCNVNKTIYHQILPNLSFYDLAEASSDLILVPGYHIIYGMQLSSALLFGLLLAVLQKSKVFSIMLWYSIFKLQITDVILESEVKLGYNLLWVPFF